MPPAEITLAETAERARLLSVDSYDVSLDLTGGDVFGSTSVVRFGCAEPGASSYADLIAENVRQITLNGADLDPAAVCSGGRIALSGLAARNELRVVADCRYSSTGAGLHRTVDSADGKVYLYTNFEPADARRVFANFEQPDLKAEFAFHVTARALDRAVQPACPRAGASDPGHAGRRAGRGLALPAHAADLHLRDRGRRG